MLFSSLASAKYVPLPEELLNEPFAFEDNGKRPKRMTPIRKSFLFIIDSDERRKSTAASCWIGEERVTYIASEHNRVVPKKNATNLSVVSVYDLYGLGIACSYLKHLYLASEHDVGVPYHWLTSYLQGSLAVLWPGSETMDDPNIFWLISALLFKLTQMDYAQPRLSEELVPHESTLPPELLYRVLDDPTLSKSMQRGVMAVRCVLPTREELTIDHERPYTLRLRDGSYLREENEGSVIVHLKRNRDQFVLTYIERTYDKNDEHYYDTEGGEIVAFSIDDYERWFNRRGCDAREHTSAMLKELSVRLGELNESNIDLACAWTVQLVGDLGRSYETDTMVFVGYAALRDELLDLLKNAIIDL